MNTPQHIDRHVRWFRVDNQLPDDETTVLVCDSDGDIELGYHRGGGWYTTQDIPIISVLYWADLPEVPQ